MDSWRRSQWPIAGGLCGVLLTLVVSWRGDVDPINTALLVLAAAVGTVAAIVDGEQRYRRDVAVEIEREQQAAEAVAAGEEDERLAARSLARNVREIMLETALYTDVNAFQGWAEGQRANPGKVILKPLVWSVDGIVERGAAGLETPVAWSALADALRTHAETASSNAGTYAGRLSVGASRALESVMVAAELVAKAAEGGSASSYAMGANRWATPDEKRPIEDRLRDARSGLIAALLNLTGTIERLERWGDPPTNVEDDPA